MTEILQWHIEDKCTGAEYPPFYGTFQEAYEFAQTQITSKWTILSVWRVVDNIRCAELKMDTRFNWILDEYRSF